MSEEEFAVLDELYFVTDFAGLQAACGLPEDCLRQVLYRLIGKGWVKCLADPETEIPCDDGRFARHPGSLYYLATKKGLMAHNSR